MAIICTILLFTGIILLWVFKNPGYKMLSGKSTINLPGMIRLHLTRLILPYYARIKKIFSGSVFYAQVVEKKEISTEFGKTFITIYRPDTIEEMMLPVYVNFHGGGFVLGYPEQDDCFCGYMVHHVGCIVINVDYLLGPEHPFPVPVLQCYDIVKWVYQNAGMLGANHLRIAVGGHGAGATIAAVISQMAVRMKEIIIKSQVLNYGWFDVNAPSSNKSLRVGKRQLLTVKQLDFYINLCFQRPSERCHPVASPLLDPDFTGLPAALIITASNDLLYTDSRRYADRLIEAGVCVTYHEFSGADHGFTYFGPSRQRREAWNLITGILKKTL